jgi:hypothetical protein
MKSIVGIAGKAGSGKDTVADILVKGHGFTKVALADPLKRICREVFKFTDEQLWGPSRSRNAGDVRYPREHSCRQGFHCDCCGVDLDLENDLPCYLTPRFALQQLGSEWGRHCFADTWVDIAVGAARFLLSGEEQTCYPPNIPTYYPQTGAIWLSECSEKSFHPSGDGGGSWNPEYYPEKRRKHAKGVVISDVRFPNEVKKIKAAGGKIWRTTHGEGLQGAARKHISESFIDELEVDAVFPQVGLEELPKIVESLLSEMK